MGEPEFRKVRSGSLVAAGFSLRRRLTERLFDENRFS